MSGEEALKLVEEHDPDLVLLDVVMPGMDGYSVCRSIRANDETALLPVIMVTSSIGPEKTEAIEAGADDFIPKPFNHGELLTRVRSLLRIKRYQDEIKELNRTLEQRVQSQVDALERQADELRASRARIVAAADAERRRIERRPARRGAAVPRRARREPERGRRSDRIRPGQGEGDPGRAVRDDRPGDAGVPRPVARHLPTASAGPRAGRGAGQRGARASHSGASRPGRDRPLRARRRGDDLFLLRRGTSERGQARRRERVRSAVGAERNRVLRGGRRRPRDRSGRQAGSGPDQHARPCRSHRRKRGDRRRRTGREPPCAARSRLSPPPGRARPP